MTQCTERPDDGVTNGCPNSLLGITGRKRTGGEWIMGVTNFGVIRPWSSVRKLRTEPVKGDFGEWRDLETEK